MFIVVRNSDIKLDFLSELIDKPSDLRIINYGNSIKSNVKIYNDKKSEYGYLVNLLEIIIELYEELPEFIVCFQIEEGLNEKNLGEGLKKIKLKLKKKDYNLLNPISFCKPIINYIHKINEIVKYARNIIDYELDLRMILPIWEKNDMMILTKENILKHSKDYYQKILIDLKSNPFNINNLYYLFSIITGY
jgi:hypothetical protein